MDKVRIHEIAKELGIKSKEVVEKAADMGLDVKAASSAVSTDDAEKLMNYVLTGVKEEVASSPKTSPSSNDSIQTQDEKKSSPKKEVQVKEEPKKEKVLNEQSKEDEKAKVKKERPKETLAQASVTKRRGLVIVKKKRPEKEEREVIVDTPVMKKKSSEPLEAVFSNANDSAQKKKKKVKKGPAEKKIMTEKMDISFGSELSEASIDFEEELVVLPDLSVKAEPQSDAKKKKIDPSQIRTTNKKSTFVQQGIQRTSKKKKRPKKIETKAEVTSVQIPEEIRVYEFAEKINRQASEIIKELFNLGEMFTKNDFLDKESIEILAEIFGVEVSIVDAQEEFDYVKAYHEDDDENLVERAPIITIMGHVDHGKTSLLDYIRNAKVAAGEAGGITQHVGAYMVQKDGKNITFIDTPGHEAFTEMRSRGAQVTDIVIVVVAADDGVMPQTREAIDHAKAAKVPIIIAVNKMDKEAANPDLVKTQLAELGIMPIDWGGEYEFVHVSAHTGMGIEDLLEVINLQAEVMELKANPNREAKATVIESSVEKGRGPVATVVIEDGTLRQGDTIVAGVAYGKVRALLDDTGKAIKEAKPGEPAVVLGLSETPGAGEHLVSVKSDKIAREYAQKRAEYLRQKELSKSTKVTLDELSSMIAEGSLKTLPVIIKADVQGSLEAIKGSLEKIRTEETKINVISSGVGGITESDVALASASENCVILGFHIRPTGIVKEKAKNAGVEIKTYNIIYDLIDDVKGLIAGMLSPIIREENIGQAQVREVFMVPKIGAIAGCIVTDGVINRGVKVRLIREGIVIYESTVSSLKRFKDDVREVAKGYECGIGIDGFNDIRVGDFIESFKEVEEKATLA
ncbi:MAG TPA: translation initiation factor IF-2 [Sulfurospirillum sp. UBA12182]|jgi:translation initiation factor IF-2|nr:MAG TPA: translation initiation factor IF-2 [Sulfurospirillum sp. UBA12182]